VDENNVIVLAIVIIGNDLVIELLQNSVVLQLAVPEL